MSHLVSLEETKKAIEVMQANEAGEQIEFRKRPHGEWTPVDEPSWEWYTNEYRVRPKVRFVYLNVYSSGRPTRPHKTRAEADQMASSGRLGCIKVELKEGQYDD